MEIIIRPYKGFGPIDFGMAGEDVSRVLGPPTDQVSPQRWLYEEQGLFIDFDDEGFCKYMEAQYEKNSFAVKNLGLTGSYEQVVASLNNAGYELIKGSEETGNLFTTFCPELGILLWQLEENEKLELIGAWRRGGKRLPPTVQEPSN